MKFRTAKHSDTYIATCNVHIHTHTYTQTHTHIRMHTYTQIHTQIHTDTYTHTNNGSFLSFGFTYFQLRLYLLWLYVSLTTQSLHMYRIAGKFGEFGMIHYTKTIQTNTI